jgi:hypothetical protein
MNLELLRSKKKALITLFIALLQGTSVSPCRADVDSAGYIDKVGHIIVKVPLANGRHEFSDQLALEEGKAFVYFDLDGRKILNLKGSVAGPFSEGLACFGKYRFKTGFVGKDGKLKIAPDFEAASDFSGSRACVRRNGKCGFIDTTGRPSVPAKFDNLAQYSEGLAAAEENGKIGFIDQSGEWKIRPQYDLVSGFSEGFSYVSNFKSGLSGYIGYDGKIAIELPSAQNDKAKSMVYFDYGQKVGRGVNLIVGLHKLAIWVPLYPSPKIFHEDLAVSSNEGLLGYIDKSGIFQIKPQFNLALPFSDGRALVAIGDKFGFIDNAGKAVIPLQYRKCYSFADGLAAVQTADGHWGFIDKHGAFVIQAKYKDARPFSEGRAWVHF